MVLGRRADIGPAQKKSISVEQQKGSRQNPQIARFCIGLVIRRFRMSLQQVIAGFRSQFRGTVIEPEDPEYEEARKVYNGMIDRRPRLLALCTDSADVMAAVHMARTNALRVSIRAGGHNAAGLGVCDEGMVIDLSRMKFVRVDPAARTVLVGAGCTWSDVDHA